MDKALRLKSNNEAKVLFGTHDENLDVLERELGVSISSRGDSFKIAGPDKDVERAHKLIEELLLTIRNGGFVKRHELLYAIKALKENPDLELHNIYLDRIEVSSKRLYITPKSKGQKDYVDAIRHYDIVFCVGPAGTGKTYLAMAMAVNALRKDIVSRIILTRHAIEAGGSPGVFSGDMKEKVMPYLRPLYDALYDMLEIDSFENFMERGIIEIAPLAFMRGRTLND